MLSVFTTQSDGLITCEKELGISMKQSDHAGMKDWCTIWSPKYLTPTLFTLLPFLRSAKFGMMLPSMAWKIRVDFVFLPRTHIHGRRVTPGNFVVEWCILWRRIDFCLWFHEWPLDPVTYFHSTYWGLLLQADLPVKAL